MHMMTLWMTLLACGDKAATDTADTTYTEDAAEDTSTEDTSTTTDEARPPVRPFCKLMTSTGEYNGDTAFDNTFTWDGYTQSFEGEQNVYNEFGVIEYSYRAEEYEYEGETLTYFYEDT
jgi:cobalamin biosynthesis protein CobT